ncbi:multidrug efflux SMR transporter, partial [Streptomyces sp. SID7499]|nr:multidrug efflux SMR transporter [Streptomyces sp. SID7499]
MAWVILTAAGLLEIVWALALKESNGFTKLWPSVIGVSFSMLSFVLLTFALREVPVGTGYAVWVGIGAAGVVAAGIVQGEAASAARLA